MSVIPQQYRAALELEQSLGDPARAENLMSQRNAMVLDEADAFPEAAISFLHNLGVHHLYVPENLGGRFQSSETFIAAGRVLARRNMSVAVSYSTMLWSTLVWIGGNSTQQQHLSDWILSSGEFPCLAYSESQHGADLSANELVARRNENGEYCLSGEKWPINRATRSGLVVLLARTDDGSHLRNHSLFILNKRDLDSRRYYHLPRVKTHGLRGCDISGIGFRHCTVPSSVRIGSEGQGLELALKGFQVTRTFCTALSLGVGDSALRLVTDFAMQRKLYGNSIAMLPHTREVLANAYLSQLIGECVSIIAARGLHLYPRQFSSWSSIAKVQVSHLVDHACQQLASILGARYYLREQHYEGIFQKILRDGAIVSVFDGSSIVCLDSLATLLPSLAIARRQYSLPTTDYRPLYDLQVSLPTLPFQELDLFCRGRNAVTESLPHLMDALETMSADETISVETLQALRLHTREIEAELSALEDEILSDPPQRGMKNSAAQFNRAERYCALNSTISCIGFWVYNRTWLAQSFASGIWLLATLMRKGDTYFRSGSLVPQHTENLVEQLINQVNHRAMLSLLAWPLATSGLAESLPPTDLNKKEHQHALKFS